MKIKEITARVRVEFDHADDLRLSIEVYSDRGNVGYLSREIRPDDLHSHFDLIFYEAKRSLLKELQKSCPETQPSCSCQEK